MATEHLYEVATCRDGDRKGILSAAALNTTIEVATPPEFPRHFRKIQDLHFEDFHCKTVGLQETVKGKYIISKVMLAPVVRIAIADNRRRPNVFCINLKPVALSAHQ